MMLTLIPKFNIIWLLSWWMRFSSKWNFKSVNHKIRKTHTPVERCDILAFLIISTFAMFQDNIGRPGWHTRTARSISNGPNSCSCISRPRRSGIIDKFWTGDDLVRWFHIIGTSHFPLHYLTLTMQPKVYCPNRDHFMCQVHHSFTFFKLWCKINCCIS